MGRYNNITSLLCPTQTSNFVVDDTLEMSSTLRTKISLKCLIFQDAKNGAEIKAVDAYCWLHSTVHLDTSLLRKLNTMPQVRAPCIGLNTASTGLDSSNTPMETLYYQWVPFFLLFQVRKKSEQTMRKSMKK